MILIKVLILISGNDSGGAAQYILNLCSMKAENIEIILGCIGGGYLYEEGNRLSFQTVLFSSKSSINGEIINYTKENSIDIVNFNGAKLFLFHRLMGRKLDCICIATVHSDYKIDFINNKIKHLVFTPLSKWGLKSFDKYICVSNHLKATLEAEGFKGDKYVVNNGIDTNSIINEEMYKDLKAKYGIKTKDFLIVSIARLHPIKNHMKMLEAFKLLVQDFPNTKLLCVGEGDHRKAIEEKIIELDLNNHVILVGFQKNTLEFLAVSDISILTSLNEAGDPPIVILESGIANKPVICSDIGNLKEILRPEFSYLINPLDGRDIYLKMKEAYNNCDSLDLMGRLFNEQVKDKFSLEVFYEKYKKIFLDLFENRRTNE